MAKTFEEIVITMLGKIDSRLDRIELTLQEHSTLHRQHQQNFKRHDEMFARIIDGLIPEIEKRVQHGETLQDHEQRLTTLETT